MSMTEQSRKSLMPNSNNSYINLGLTPVKHFTIEEYDEYGHLNQGGILSNMTAGAAAGIVEHCIMYPVDCIKTRMMLQQPVTGGTYRGIVEGLRSVILHESPRNLFRGIGFVACGAGPAHACYYTTYETFKRQIGEFRDEHDSQINYAISGAFATLVHDSFMTPVDAVKQRLQMFRSPYKNVYNAIHGMFMKEGIRAFYRSFTTQLSMNIPTQSTNFVVYETVHILLNPEKCYNPKVHVVAGCLAGAAAAVISTPMDVAKTLLNVQEKSLSKQLKNNKPIIGMINSFSLIYRTNGMSGFIRGLRARVVYLTPSTGISWSVYELFKYILGLREGKRV
ncbi:hypothetical protein LOD99_3715 [Oopsacas minuta]|uniref:Mitoferrin-1 n=1 Tax=Oopsacas minuta TaxID=111878 RepID=A0AAV7JWM7_9METZ|nr:hypothetical protein LOD99_3715 [Oopsacas minuta]